MHAAHVTAPWSVVVQSVMHQKPHSARSPAPHRGSLSQ
jgi:hypothetical protein